MKRVLIGYVTKTNTTREAALEIGSVLQKQGFDAQILPLSEVTSLEGFDAVIIGAPINGMNWHIDAVKFVESHKDELKKIPTSFYFMSYLLFVGCEFWRKIIRKSLDKVSMQVKPMKVGMFGGKIAANSSVAFRFIFGIKKNALSDVRNQKEVYKWAQEWVIMNT